MTMRAVALRRLLLFAALLFSPFVWAEQVTLNFKDTDIQTVTEMVSKITGRNFIVDPRVKGNVTVISSEPLDAEALYATFLSILRVHGFVAIDNGNVVKIMPAATAREEAPVARATAAGDEIQVEVLEVRHAPAAQMVPILRPLVEKEGHLAAHATSNTLIVAASRRTIDKIRGMLVQIDQDTDTEVEAIRLRYAPAEEMVRTLQSLEPTRKGKPAEGGTVTNIVAEPRTNSLLVSGSSGFRERIRKLVKVLDTEVADQRDVHVVYLRYAKAKDLEPIIDQLATERSETEQAATGGGEAAAVTTKVMVQADEQTNALIITARPDLYRDIKAVIERLDIRRDQVLVEALIVEVSQDKAADFGVQWVGVQNDLVDDLSLGDSDVSTLAPGTLIGVLRAGEYSFGALAKALDNDADANLLSTPSLLTLDNQEAEIVVARQVPFITGSFTSISEGGSANPENPFQTIERSNVGLTLRITPQINEGDAVRLAVDQEISQILPDAASAIGASDVVTSIRSIKTNVIVEDGATLVLGGLIDDLVRESESRIPFLGDIPIAGELFTFRSVEAEKTNLMIFIRPVILRNAVTNLAATEDRYNDVREMQLERHERGVKLLSESEQPVLQPLDAEGRPIKGPPVLAAPEPAPEPAAQDDFLIHDYDY